MDDIIQYSKSENFKYFVIEASHGDYYGFNTKVKKEREIAANIVSEYDNFIDMDSQLPIFLHLRIALRGTDGRTHTHTYTYLVQIQG